MNGLKTPGFQMICISVLVCFVLSVSSYSTQRISNKNTENAISESKGQQTIEAVQDSVYVIADIMPQFPGGKAPRDRSLYLC